MHHHEPEYHVNEKKKKKLDSYHQGQDYSEGWYSQNIALSPVLLILLPHSGELRMQILHSHLVRTQSLNVLPLKPGVGQCIAIHAMFTARDFFLAFFCPSSPFTCISSKTSPDLFVPL